MEVGKLQCHSEPVEDLGLEARNPDSQFPILPTCTDTSLHCSLPFTHSKHTGVTPSRIPHKDSMLT